MRQVEYQSEIQDLALRGFGKCFKPLSVSELLDHSVWMKQHIFLVLNLTPHLRKKGLSQHTNHLQNTLAKTDGAPRTKPNFYNLWLLR